MGNYDNIKDKGFDSRNPQELMEISKKGGKARAKQMKRQANLRKALNLLLTVKVDSPEWTDTLEAMGLDSTLESAITAAIVKEAMKGNVKAYAIIRDTLGQTTKSAMDEAEQEARIDKVKAETKRQEAEVDRLNTMGNEVEDLDDLEDEIYGED